MAIDEQIGTWIGCILGVVALFVLIGIFFVWRYNSGGWSEFRTRLINWHDPQTLELQDVHSNRFANGVTPRATRRLSMFNSAQESKHNSRNFPLRNSLNTARKPEPAVGASPYTNINDSTAHLNPEYEQRSSASVPSLSVSDTSTGMIHTNETWLDVELAFPKSIASPLTIRTSISDTAQPSISYDHKAMSRCGSSHTDLQIPAVTIRPATPESQRTVRIIREHKPTVPKQIDSNLTASTLVGSRSESCWTDVTDVTSSMADSVEMERGDKVVERQQELFRRMRDKGYSTDEAQRVLTGGAGGGRKSPEGFRVEVRALKGARM